MKFLLIHFCLLFSFNLWAQRIPNTLKAQFSLRQSILEIDNPDNSVASYNGFTVATKLLFPIKKIKQLTTFLTGGFRYSAFDNAANSSLQSENATYYGPNLGAELSLFGFFVGTDYEFLKGRHSAVGIYTKNTDVAINALSFRYGFRYNLGRSSFGLALHQLDSALSKSDTGLSEDSSWRNTGISINFIYNFSGLNSI